MDALHVYLQAKRGRQNLLQMVVSHHAIAGNSEPLAQQPEFLTSVPSLEAPSSFLK